MPMARNCYEGQEWQIDLHLREISRIRSTQMEPNAGAAARRLKPAHVRTDIVDVITCLTINDICYTRRFVYVAHCRNLYCTPPALMHIEKVINSYNAL